MLHGNLCQKLRMDFGSREATSAPYVRYLLKKVKETGIFIQEPKREKRVRTPQNIAAVAESATTLGSGPANDLQKRILRLWQ